MSKAALLITSPGSTFGYAAAAAASANSNMSVVMTVAPGGRLVVVDGARVFSHSKVSARQRYCWNI